MHNAGLSGAFLLGRYGGLPVWGAGEAAPSACLLPSSSSFAPYIEHFREQVQPGRDGFPGEQYAAELEEILDGWRVALCASPRNLDPIASLLPPALDAAELGAAVVTTLRGEPPIESEKAVFPATRGFTHQAFLQTLTEYLAPLREIKAAQFEVFGIEVLQAAPLQVSTDVHYDVLATLDHDRREERVGTWSLIWKQEPEGAWQILNWSAGGEQRSRVTGPGFVDITGACFAGSPSYQKQLRRGVDYWRTALDGACGIDIYGNNGVAIGDFDGDGFDDLYVCQPAGLPNLLYRNRGDGTFEDVTAKAGVGILDGTSSALFADLNNSGRQDLIVVRTSGPLLYVNRGDGSFELKPEAFHFARAPQGTFTGIAAADYDRDGLLDVYFCLYSFYQGLSDYQFPSPFYDAVNGPPNFLMKNQGGYRFADVTAAAGMDRNNNRYTFTCGWNDYNDDGWPDLYVVNDFGRKVLYHNNGDGTFRDVSAQAGVEDPGEGMSMTWLDYDNDGHDDLYVVNMWEPAGLRVMSQDQFAASAPARVRAMYRQDAMGNTLLHNEAGKGVFRDVTEDSGTRLGGWNWGSDSWDLDHDGYPDLYVTNGFISGAKAEDLSSFFWRQVVTRSFAAGGKSQGYQDAWNAINEFIRADYSWSGLQRNNCYVNNRNRSFTEAGGPLGLDCLDDSRAFALADLDHDGRLEVILKNRTGPQIRVLHNRLNPLGRSIGFSLQGRKSNRDGIGAVIELEMQQGRQRKTVSAGSGFLMQHTKQVHFGVGDAQGPVRAHIRWPDGSRQTLENLPVGHAIEIVEGLPGFKAAPFAPAANSTPGAAEPVAEPLLTEPSETWLVDPVLAPGFALPDGQGRLQRLSDYAGQWLALLFCAPECSESQRQLHAIQSAWPGWQHARLQVLAMQAVDARGPNPVAKDAGFSFPVVAADQQVCAIYNIFHRYLFDRRRDLALPTAFLVDSRLAVVKVYRGCTDCAHILLDLETCRSAPAGQESRLGRALPFAGKYVGKGPQRNYFTYGVAYLRYGYPDQALASFQEALARDPTYAAAYYNIGLIYLSQHKLAVARANLERSIELDPENANVWNNLGVVYGQSEDYAQASRAFEKALALEPAHLLALRNLVKLYTFQGRSADARKLLQAAMSAHPERAELHLELGTLLAQNEDFAGAKKQFETSVELEPENVEALNGLGVVLMKMGDTADAITRWQACRKLAPDYDRAYLNLALLYVKLGDTRKAREILREFPLALRDSADIRKALKEIEGGR
jgi:Flp pilus assembly protein TadD/peroxiredoxin